MLALKTWLSEPLTRGLDLDDPALTSIRRQVLQQKPVLRSIYTEWYQMLLGSIPAGPGAVLELGSGAGFLKELLPEVISSEVFHLPYLSLALDGCAIPFQSGALKAILMTDVLHHIPNVRLFFSEAQRCLQPGGVIAMIEPWYTRWSGLVYRRLHHEPFRPEAEDWSFDTSGPLSGANGALPWIVFERDLPAFRQAFPGLSLAYLRPLMPFSYLLAGGLSYRSMLPARVYPAWRAVERFLDARTPHLGMFGFIVVRKTAGAEQDPPAAGMKGHHKTG